MNSEYPYINWLLIYLIFKLPTSSYRVEMLVQIPKLQNILRVGPKRCFNGSICSKPKHMHLRFT